MILCIGTTPAVQRVMTFRKLSLDTVNRATHTLDGAAGKSINVAKVLQALGESPLALGFLGGDRGEYLRAVLQEKGIASEFVNVSARTRQCITVLDESAGTQTELVEESQPVPGAAFEKLLGLMECRTCGCRAVIMSGTITPGGPPDFYFRCTQLASQAGALSLVDAQGPALEQALQAHPGLVKPNRLELGATLGRELRDEASVLAAMRELAERGAQRVVVTAGKEPTLAFDGRNSWRVRPPAIVPANPIGSGDAFTAGLAWRLLRGDELGEACRWANAAGAANALTLMPGELNRAEVDRLAGQVSVRPI